MNNFCLRRDEKVKDSRVTLQLFWQWIRQKETFLSLILMFFWYKFQDEALVKINIFITHLNVL